MATIKNDKHSRICPRCHIFVDGTNKEIYNHTESCDGLPGIITTRWYTVEELYTLSEPKRTTRRPVTR